MFGIVVSIPSVDALIPVTSFEFGISSTVEINDSTPNGSVLSDSDVFGGSTANIGDLNNDGVSDIAVGARGDDNGGTDRGAIHILFSDLKNRFADNVFRIVDNVDNTKQIVFEASNISPSTTRTFTLPDTNGTIPLLESANIFTSNQTINGKLDIGNSGISNDWESLTIHHTADSGGGFFIQKDGNDPFFAFTGFDFEPGTRRIVSIGGGGWNVADANEIQFWTDATYTGGINEGVQRMIIKNNGNIGIGTNNPDASAVLEVSSSTQGFLPPTMNTAQRDAIALPAAGLLIYNTNTNQWEGYNGTSWVTP